MHHHKVVAAPSPALIFDTAAAIARSQKMSLPSCVATLMPIPTVPDWLVIDSYLATQRSFL